MSIRAKLKTLFTAGKGVALGLPDLAAGDDPVALFGEWFRAAEESGILLPETMILSTCTPAGRPSARAVLLKRWSRDGFVFFTNYGSRKAKELDENPFAALLFHWPILERQVRIEGTVERNLLERAGSENLCVHLAGQSQDRRAIDVGVPETGDEVGRARAGDGETRCGSSCQLSVRRCRE